MLEEGCAFRNKEFNKHLDEEVPIGSTVKRCVPVNVFKIREENAVDLAEKIVIRFRFKYYFLIYQQN
jgi:hypothetical protein